MINKDFLTEVQHRSGLDRQLCSVLMQSAIKLMAENATEQIAVEWEGIGHFLATKHPEYVSEDPDSGLLTMYPPRISYRLSQQKPGANVKELNATQFSFHLARYAKSTEVDAEFFMHTVTKLILERLDENDPVEIQGLGTFLWVESQQGRRMSLQVDDKMRSMVNAPFSCFEPVVVAAENKSKIVSDNSENLETSGSQEGLECQDSPVDQSSPESPAVPDSNAVPDSPDSNAVPDSPDSTACPDSPDCEESSDQPAQSESEAPSESVAPSEPVVQPVSVVQSAKSEVRTTQPMAQFADQFLSKLKALPQSYLYGGVAGIVVLLVLIVWLLLPSKQSAQPSGDAINSSQVIADNPDSTAVLESPDSTDSPDSLDTPDSQTSPVTPVSQKSTVNQVATETRTASTSTARPTNDMLLLENGKPVMDKLGDGGRLTLVALRHYGDKAFWAYIYDVNSFQLSDPNNVPIGLPLYLPNPGYFRIDASDPASVKRAQNRAMQILNSKK